MVLKCAGSDCASQRHRVEIHLQGVLDGKIMWIQGLLQSKVVTTPIAGLLDIVMYWSHFKNHKHHGRDYLGRRWIFLS